MREPANLVSWITQELLVLNGPQIMVVSSLLAFQVYKGVDPAAIKRFNHAVLHVK